MKKRMTAAIIALFLLFIAGCGVIPVRPEVKVDTNVPVGKIEGNQFTGIRYPFKVSAVPGWEVSTTFPEFMLQQGFEKEGLSESQVFVYNPATQSSIQIEFSPAGRHIRFNQKVIEWITTTAGTDLESEFHQTYGKNAKFDISRTERYVLKGVPYAAKRTTTYKQKGVKREHGWVYAFAEPFQIFIIYVVPENGWGTDQEAIKAILETFEVTPWKK